MVNISSWIITYIEADKKSQGAGGWLLLQGQGAKVTQYRLSPYLWATDAGRMNTDKTSNEPGPGSAQWPQPRAKGGVARNRARDKAITRVPKSIQEPGPKTGLQTICSLVQGAHWGDVLPTAQVSGSSRRQDWRHPHSYSIAQTGTEGSEVSRNGAPSRQRMGWGPMGYWAGHWGLLVPSGAWQKWS